MINNVTPGVFTYTKTDIDLFKSKLAKEFTKLPDCNEAGEMLVADHYNGTYFMATEKGLNAYINSLKHAQEWRF